MDCRRQVAKRCRPGRPAHNFVRNEVGLPQAGPTGTSPREGASTTTPGAVLDVAKRRPERRNTGMCFAMPHHAGAVAGMGEQCAARRFNAKSPLD